MGNVIPERATDHELAGMDALPTMVVEQSTENTYCNSPAPPRGENAITGARTRGSEEDMSRRNSGLTFEARTRGMEDVTRRSGETSYRSRGYITDSDESEVKQRYSTPAAVDRTQQRRTREDHVEEGEYFWTPSASPVRRRSTQMSPDDLALPESATLRDETLLKEATISKYETPASSRTPILKRSATKPLKESHRRRQAEDTSDEMSEIEEDSQRWTPPTTRRKDVSRRRVHEDTPYADKRCLSGNSCRIQKELRGRQRRYRTVSFNESSSSDTDSYIEPSQTKSVKQYMKPPKFDGISMSFETFYAQFQNCAQYNKWSKSEQLAFLKASTKSVDKAAQESLWWCSEKR